MQRTYICLLIFIGGCRPPSPARIGPLPAAHSCYRMSGALLPLVSTQASPVWLLLSDQSRAFGARSYDAMVLSGSTRVPATWRRVARDSLRVDFVSTTGTTSVVFHETPAGISGFAAVAQDAASPGPPLTGRRADCAVLVDHP